MAWALEYFNKIINEEKNKFKGFTINDCKDLIIFLYQRLHKELKEDNQNNIEKQINTNENGLKNEILNDIKNYESQNKSIIFDIFFFTQINSMECFNCNTITYNFSMNNILIFPLEKVRLYKQTKEQNFLNVNIFDCLEYHTKEQIYKNNK